MADRERHRARVFTLLDERGVCGCTSNDHVKSCAALCDRICDELAAVEAETWMAAAAESVRRAGFYAVEADRTGDHNWRKYNEARRDEAMAEASAFAARAQPPAVETEDKRRG